MSEIFGKESLKAVSVPKKPTHKISRVVRFFLGPATTYNFIKGSTKGTFLKTMYFGYSVPHVGDKYKKQAGAELGQAQPKLGWVQTKPITWSS